MQKHQKISREERGRITTALISNLALLSRFSPPLFCNIVLLKLYCSLFQVSLTAHLFKHLIDKQHVKASQNLTSLPF